MHLHEGGAKGWVTDEVWESVPGICSIDGVKNASSRGLEGEENEYMYSRIPLTLVSWFPSWLIFCGEFCAVFF